MASGKKGGKGKQKKKKDSTKEKTDELEIICYNCNKPGHEQFECWAEGGGKEGHGPRQLGSGRNYGIVSSVGECMEFRNDRVCLELRLGNIPGMVAEDCVPLHIVFVTT